MGDVRTQVGGSALKADSGRKIPCRTGEIEPASAACRSDALPAELHPRPSAQQTRPRYRRERVNSERPFQLKYEADKNDIVSGGTDCVVLVVTTATQAAGTSKHLLD